MPTTEVNLEPIELKKSSSFPTRSRTTSVGTENEDEVKSLDNAPSNSDSSSVVDTSMDIWNKDMERFTINNTQQMFMNEDINNVVADHRNNGETKNNRRRGSIPKKILDPPCRDPPEDGIWPVRDALSFTRFMTFYGHGSMSDEHASAAKMIQEARELRKKYCGSGCTEILLGDVTNPTHFELSSEGIMQLYCNEKNVIHIPSLSEFITSHNRLVEISVHGAMRSFCFQRLQLLSQAFKMHVTVNHIVENEAQSSLLGADFYRTMKVDNHIHLAAAPSAKQFVSLFCECFYWYLIMNESNAYYLLILFVCLFVCFIGVICQGEIGN